MRFRNRSLLLPLFVLVTLSLPFSASADLFLRVEGGAQGPIEGDATQMGHEDWIRIYSFSHGVYTPTSSDGLPTGATITTELALMKTLDPATLKLFSATTTQELFTTFRLDFTEGTQQGTQTTFRIDLENARLNVFQSSGSDFDVSESISFSYSRIHFTDVLLGTTVSYDWNSGPSAAPQPLAKGILLPPAPNPTSDTAEFRFSLPVGSNAELTLFDLRGRLVRELHRGWTSAEPVVAIWDGTDTRGIRVAQGLYVARLTYPGTVVTQRIAVVR